MNLLKIAGIALIMMYWPQAEAGVYRCKAPNGHVYYSDKGCNTGDPAAKPSGEGNMSVIGGRGRGVAKGKNPKYKTQNRYTRRAEAGAARADQALQNK